MWTKYGTKPKPGELPYEDPELDEKVRRLRADTQHHEEILTKVAECCKKDHHHQDELCDSDYEAEWADLLTRWRFYQEKWHWNNYVKLAEKAHTRRFTMQSHINKAGVYSQMVLQGFMYTGAPLHIQNIFCMMCNVEEKLQVKLRFTLLLCIHTQVPVGLSLQVQARKFPNNCELSSRVNQLQTQELQLSSEHTDPKPKLNERCNENTICSQITLPNNVHKDLLQNDTEAGPLHSSRDSPWSVENLNDSNPDILRSAFGLAASSDEGHVIRTNKRNMITCKFKLHLGGGSFPY
ncbi:hypothetical protein FISHEDRAFT_59897 [Fistulina hepatica ATCC 64428]|uniref:Uncharacterized protein n=1 Tax=Fistulina hepatica ATCC 64428 TaxID=1128425 RepID=A0A0D7A7S9_9AGAR|nr:hypothetical protein FISHEDRAFT_59897 [Fistulina hepatica ATCC 64428]